MQYRLHFPYARVKKKKIKTNHQVRFVTFTPKAIAPPSKAPPNLSAPTVFPYDKYVIGMQYIYVSFITYNRAGSNT